MNDYKDVFEARGHLYNDAMTRFPQARDRELNALLDRVLLEPGMAVVDAPAGGGYVAEGVHARAGQDVRLFCVEPSPRFSAAIRVPCRILNESLHETSLPDASVDVVLSLAGLHHVADRQPIYDEWARLLRPGGTVAVADVAVDTPTGGFLNTFVDAHVDGGHDGIFIGESEFSTGLEAAGLKVEADSLESVPWEFPDREALGAFCRELFGVTGVPVEQVAGALERQVGVTGTPAGVALDWQLRYAVARKPG